jgi:hypothetical protein
MTIKPERPNIEQLCDAIGMGWGGSWASGVLWLLLMLEEAHETMQYLADENIMDVRDWLARYRGDDDGD